MTTAGDVFVGWHTSASDGYSHAVTEAAFGQGVRERRGRFHTVCGHVIRLAASTAPCCTSCSACTALLQTSIWSQPIDDDTAPLPTGNHNMIPSDWPYSPGAHDAFTALGKSGFTHYCCGDRRAPHLLVSTYNWDDHGYIDVINIRGIDRVTAARIPQYDGPETVDIFAPTHAVWHYMGALEPTVTAILRLLPPHHPDAPTTPYPAPSTLFVSTREQRPMTVKPGRHR